MSLSVNGLRIRKGHENKIPKIVSLIEPTIVMMFQAEARKVASEYARKFYEYIEENPIEENNNVVSFKDFFSKNIFDHKANVLNPLFFKGTHNIEVFPLFLRNVLTCQHYSLDKYSLRFMRTQQSKRILIILPSFVNQEDLPNELFEYCENYSTENQTDDVPEHFENYREKELANREWYDIDEKGKALSYKIEIDHPVLEYLSDLEPKHMIKKFNVRLSVFNNHYLNGRDLDPHDVLDEMIDLMADNHFLKLVEEELTKKEEEVLPRLSNLKEKWGMEND